MMRYMDQKYENKGGYFSLKKKNSLMDSSLIMATHNRRRDSIEIKKPHIGFDSSNIRSPLKDNINSREYRSRKQSEELKRQEN